MDSFVLAETFKYLYLLFDEAHDPADRDTIFCEQSQPDNRLVTNAKPRGAEDDQILESAIQQHSRYQNQNHSRSGRLFSSNDEGGWTPTTIPTITVRNRPLQTETWWQYKCLHKSKSLFTTEGHIFMLDPNLPTEFITKLFGTTSALPLDLMCLAP
jgi:hypothetical protein